VSHSGSALNIHALSNLDLELHDGDRVCVIGHNGAGKTTLLRLIADIYPPTTGSVEITGNVLALLSSALTLNPDATGYENIRLFAAMYDWPKTKWPEYVRDIEDFTELGNICRCRPALILPA
jgi:homopolymeric O-antigen transport system ATP-binding protein